MPVTILTKERSAKNAINIFTGPLITMVARSAKNETGRLGYHHRLRDHHLPENEEAKNVLSRLKKMANSIFGEKP